MSSSLPEEDLSCPVCCDIFRDPVLLPCSHSFCRSCLQNFWGSSICRSCPVCRRKSSKKTPPINLALKNLCEAFVQSQSWTGEGEENSACPQHGERLKLFCIDDQQPICVVCQASRMHKGHNCAPTDEAALDCKEKLSSTLKTLKNKLDVVNKRKMTSAMTLEHIKSQSQRIEKQIRAQFFKLRQFLMEEEEARVSSLKEEEMKKMLALKERDEELKKETASLTEVIKQTEEEIDAADLMLLKNFKSTIERTQTSSQNPKLFHGSLIDEAKHLSNLKFEVWKKMEGIASYSPVTLDPNTAHPCLKLSEDLTCIHYSSLCNHLPNNPERFCISAEVLGSVPLSSGRHSWEVEVGASEDWILGVASTSIKREEEVPARPENGFWTLCIRDGEYKAMESPPKTLNVEQKLQKVLVQLDWDAGEVSFLCSEDGQTLYIFEHNFTDMVVPYFYTQSKQPLRIMPKPVLISVKDN
ncbi:zinc-binding protein A33 [Trichomycterus rosablanca]|uniref:zinc-binding protein A33 n=1 Tax=Trichomycterus rosablanca TaxID=2290929 RepID=UPI002F35819D